MKRIPIFMPDFKRMTSIRNKGIILKQEAESKMGQDGAGLPRNEGFDMYNYLKKYCKN
jgi:hypothetical protein